MEQGNFGEACPKLQASYQLDPATGTLLNLGFCQESQGSAAVAYQTYQAARARAIGEGNEERLQFAAIRILALENRVVRVILPSPVHAQGFWVLCDGLQAEIAIGSARCVVDPGKHRVDYGAPGKIAETQQIDAATPGSEVVIQLRPLRSARIARATPTLRNVSPPVSADTTRAGGLSNGTAAAISFGIAAVGAVGTLYLGWQARSEWHERNDFCASGCDERAVAAGHRANTFAWAANITGGLTVLSAGLGTYWLLRPNPKHASTTLTAGLTPDQRGALFTATIVP
jgi:hypothetical protein